MTTKVLIVNFGPDPVLVRTVDYGPADLPTKNPAIIVDDQIVAVQQSREFYVHVQQQLLIGEKRSG